MKYSIEETLKTISVCYDFSDKPFKVINIFSKEPYFIKAESGGSFYFIKIKKLERSNFQNSSQRVDLEKKFDGTGIIVPKLITLKDGTPHLVLDGYIVEVSEWIDFTHYSGTEEEFLSVLDLLGKSEDCFRRIPVNCIDKDKIEAYIQNKDISIQQLDYLLSIYLPDYHDAIMDLNRRVDFFLGITKKEISDCEIQYIHGDYNLKNIGFIENEAHVLMDFERAKIGFPVEDVSSCYFELCIKNVPFELISKKSDLFFRKLQENGVLLFSEELLVYVLAKRMIRHIYRALERMDKNEDIFRDFYTVFINEGIVKLQKYIKSKFTTINEKTGKEINQVEFQLLLKVANYRGEKAFSLSEDEIGLLSSSSEVVNHFIGLCLKHRLVPALYSMLISTDLYNKLPSYWKLTINNYISYCKEYRTLNNGEFKKINEVLQQNEIDYVCIKGIALDRRYFKINPFLFRNFTDMDFLVAPEELSKVEKLFKEMGYKRGFYDYFTSEMTPVPRSEEIYYRFSTHQVYPFTKPMENFSFSPVNVYKVDVNFSIFFGGKLKDVVPAIELIKEKKWVAEEDFKFPVLSIENELIQLAYAFYKDTVYEVKKNGNAYILSFLRDINNLFIYEKMDLENAATKINSIAIKRNIIQVLHDVYICFENLNVKKLLEFLGETIFFERREIVKENIMVL